MKVLRKPASYALAFLLAALLLSGTARGAVDWSEPARVTDRVRILSDPQVVVLYHVQHSDDTRRWPKVLGVRMAK